MRRTSNKIDTTWQTEDRVGKGELHPQTSHGTVLDTLASHGSSNSINHLRLSADITLIP